MRKRKYFISIGLFLMMLICFYRGAFAENDSHKDKVVRPQLPDLTMPDNATFRDEKEVKLMWCTSVSKEVTSIKVYATKSVKLSNLWQKKFLRAAGINDNVTDGLDVSCAAKTNDWQLQVEPSGALWLTSIRDATKNPAKFPTREKAIEIAKEFLISRGLWEDNISGSNVVDNTKGANVISVGFRCEIDDMPVIGPGARILVDIGPNKTVKRIFKSWPNIEDVAEYPIISAEEAICRFNAGKAYFCGGSQGAIRRFELVYWAPPGMSCKYLLPAWVIAFSQPGDQEESLAYLPAVVEEFMKQQKSNNVLKTVPTTQRSK